MNSSLHCHINHVPIPEYAWQYNKSEVDCPVSSLERWFAISATCGDAGLYHRWHWNIPGPIYPRPAVISKLTAISDMFTEHGFQTGFRANRFASCQIILIDKY